MNDTWTDAGEGELDVRPADDGVPYGECACDDCCDPGVAPKDVPQGVLGGDDDPAAETDY